MSSEALYFPYTNIRSLESLKAMILYFDKINLIDPLQASINDTHQNYLQYETLKLNNVLNYFSPSKLLTQYDNVLTENIMSDLNDENFISMSKNKDLPEYWEIYAEKIPSRLQDSVLRKYLVNIPNLYESKKIQHYHEGPMYYEERRHMYNQLKEISDARNNVWHEQRIVRLDFEMGESLMINHALCACDLYKLTPITDESIHYNFYKYKFEKTKNISILKNTLVNYRYIKNMNIDLSSVEVIRETLPSLVNAEVNDVLTFKDENKDALKKFKIEMGKIVTDVEAHYWDEDFHKKIIDAIDSTIRPAIQEIKDSTESIKDKLLRAVRGVAYISPVPLIVTIFPGLDPILLLGAGAGLAVLDHYLESRKQNKEKKKNSFLFLFEAQKRFPQ